jgi:DNA-binding winged helix-turn-helix (wHTH) protein
MARNREDLPTLIAQTGPLSGQRFSLEESLLAGRDGSCDITIPDRQVSRYHARFTITPEGAVLEDLGSKNGTHYNGHLISAPVTLQDGDVIQIALAQQFMFISSDTTATIPFEPGEAEISPMLPRRLLLEKRSRRVWVDDKEIVPPLSVSQFRLLELLCDRNGRVVDRKEMVASVWGDENAFDVSEQALDALIRRLRDRLAAFDPTYTYIVTVRGHGLRLDNPPV